jgi:RNA polymerase sigma factor for flagellar operon FliA
MARTAVESPPARPGDAPSGDAEARLWHSWRGHADAEARQALISHHQPYARLMAAVLYRGRITNEIEFDEYLQLASLGLIEAVDRYDPAQGAQFKTYAAHRIRGTILSGLEQLSEKNQQIAFHKRLRSDRLQALKADAAEATGLKALNPRGTSAKQQQALLAYLAEVGIGLALSVMLEGTGMIAADASEPEPLPVSPDVSYFKKAETRQLQSLLRELIARLPEPERKVIRAHYQQEIPFDEISTALGVSRSRTAQLHRQALASLRKAMAQGPPIDVVW